MTEAMTRRNEYTCLTLRGVWSVFLAGSVLSVYYQSRGLTQTQIYTLQATWAIVMSLATIPGGHMADRFGIRRITIIGTLVQCLQATLLWQSRAFWHFETALVLAGLNMALLSGVIRSMMMRSYDQFDKASAKERYRVFEKRSSQIGSLGLLVGALAGGYLTAHTSISFAMGLQPLVFLVGAGAAIALIEPDAHKESRRPIRGTVKMMLWDRADIRRIVLFSAVIDSTQIVYFWQLQPKLQLECIPLGLFGLLAAERIALTILVSGCLRLLLKCSLLKLQGALVVGLVSAPLFAGVPGWVGIVGFFATHAIVSALSLPLGAIALSEALPPALGSRTTEVAISATVQSCLFAIVSPVVGWAADAIVLQHLFYLLALSSLLLGGLAWYRLYRAAPR